jgi:CheY-like chemotaxis protein
MVKVSVLYLDDEEPLVCLVTHLLTRIGYDVCGFTTRDEALTAFRSNPGRYSLVLTDMSMPGTSGLEFAVEILAIAPGARVAILTGQVNESDVARATTLGVRAVVQKPTTLDELGPIVSQLLM